MTADDDSTTEIPRRVGIDDVSFVGFLVWTPQLMGELCQCLYHPFFGSYITWVYKTLGAAVVML